MENRVKDKAMLARLRVSSWSGEKLDKRVTVDILAREAAGNKVGRFTKQLLPGDALKPVSKAVNLLREVHKQQTLPYDDTHWRVLPTSNYVEYMAAINKHVSHLSASVEGLIQSYEFYKEQARAQLNGMFNEADYPTPEEIRERFKADFEPRSMPDAGNFMVDLADDTMAELSEDMEKRTKQRLGDAQGDLWRRLLEITSHFATVMSDNKKVFRDTTVSNVEEIVNLVPRLNLSDDPALDALADEIKNSLCGFDPTVLREGGAVRDDAAAKGKEAVDKITALMQGAY